MIMMTNENKPPLPPMYTLMEVADMFKISRSTVFRLKKSQDWPHHQFGSEIRFSQEDVEAIRAKNQKPQPRAPRQRAPRIPKRGEAPRIPKRT
ncbi:helix-turn-helix domain-containing protein [Paenarthrobacter sp. NPDC089316]|uniref:helix-turn-helix domain-containing protein n=1 Tax=unclassified Paenarthrobacter TaxID=2634190 RepID=UPI0034170E65